MSITKHPMPLQDRMERYGDLYHALIPYTITCVIIFFILFGLIGIAIYKNKKHGLLVFLTAISFAVSMFLIALMFYQKLIIVNNIKDMHYITFKAEGVVTNVSDESLYAKKETKNDDFTKDLKNKDVRTVLIKSDDKNFIMKVDKSYHIDHGDKVKLASTKKIPADNEFDINKLNFISNRTSCYIQHDGSWKKVNIPYLDPDKLKNRYKIKEPE